jgi:hypothetical protein
MKHLLSIVSMVAASTGVLPAEVTEPKERPNFLIIMVDDLSPEQFACYGNEVNHTPNLDALACRWREVQHCMGHADVLANTCALSHWALRQSHWRLAQ